MKGSSSTSFAQPTLKFANRVKTKLVKILQTKFSSRLIRVHKKHPSKTKTLLYVSSWAFEIRDWQF